jgi:hypothetical protein
MAKVSSPLAEPPLFIPAARACDSMSALLDAARDRYSTALDSFLATPHPCLGFVRFEIGGKEDITLKLDRTIPDLKHYWHLEDSLAFQTSLMIERGLFVLVTIDIGRR